MFHPPEPCTASAVRDSAPPAKRRRPTVVEQAEQPRAQSQRCRQLCSLGTGEVVHILVLRARDASLVRPFESTVQTIARELYSMESGVTDVRICHPRCGQICFVITFAGERELAQFRAGPERQMREAMQELLCLRRRGNDVDARLAAGGWSHSVLNLSAEDDDCSLAVPQFECTGTLMPKAHSLQSLLGFLKANIKGSSFSDHNVKLVADECAKWFPRREEYDKFVHWDPHDPTKYTRNLIFRNEHFECLLMCWPARSKSSIHCHDRSSCWVVLVEGEVVEVQFAMPKLDLKFLQAEMKDPSGAVGRCGPLKLLKETKMGFDADLLSSSTPASDLDGPEGVIRAKGSGITTTYANNDIGIHRVENRTDAPACTLHIYAPGLRKLKTFKESGDVATALMTVASCPSLTSDCGSMTGMHSNPDGILDVERWNRGL